MHMTYEDVSVDSVSNPQVLKVRLKTSKTDPFRQGIDIVVGRSSNKLCPVVAMLAYLVVRSNKPGFLFQLELVVLMTQLFKC